MENKALSVVESLRFANHDFMNHLHLINMNLELGRIQETKEIIKQISEKYRSFSVLNKISLPKTVEWLYTFSWRFPAIQLTINGNITNSNITQNDDEIVEYLEESIHHVYNGLDPYTEQHLTIGIIATNDQFKLQVHLTGKWDSNFSKQGIKSNLKVQTYEKTKHSWKYELTSE